MYFSSGGAIEKRAAVTGQISILATPFGAAEQITMCQIIRPANADPERLRVIVQTGAKKAATKALVFGMWVRDREVLTTALGNSMTSVPATTEMHYRIGGIGETFMSTLLLMLVEQEQISLDEKISRWFPQLLAADQVTVRMLVANTAGYIDYVTVEDFLKLQLAEPFRTFTDEELINYSVRNGKMNFPPGTSQQYSHTENVILGQVIRGDKAAHQGALRKEHLWAHGHE